MVKDKKLKFLDLIKVVVFSAAVVGIFYFADEKNVTGIVASIGISVALFIDKVKNFNG